MVKLLKKFDGALAVSILVATLMIILVVYPDRYVSTTFDGIKVWAFNVLPSLLPFFFFTNLLTRLKYASDFALSLSPVSRVLYGADGLGVYAQVMSFLSGYPVGVKIISDLYSGGLIDRKQATKYSTFCSTSGPLFIVGTVGVAIFQSKKIGVILLISHLLSSILTGVIFRCVKTAESKTPTVAFAATDNILYESVYSSVVSVSIVGGFIAVFYTIARVCFDFNLFYPLTALLSPLVGEKNANGIAMGLIECTFACRQFAENVSILSVCLSCGAITFGGLSVWCQSAVYIKKANASFITFALSKIVQCVISMIICYLLLLIAGL